MPEAQHGDLGQGGEHAVPRWDVDRVGTGGRGHRGWRSRTLADRFASDTHTSSSPEQRFTAVLEAMRRMLDPVAYRTWFRSVRLGGWRAGHLTIVVPNLFCQEWFQSKFHGALTRAAEQVAGAPTQVIIALPAAGAESPSATEGAAPPATTGVPGGDTPAGPPAQTPAGAGPLPGGPPPLTSPTYPQIVDASPPSGPPAVLKSDATRARLLDMTPLISNYSFENFVTGPSNEMAYASARGVADEPARNYNPLFIYGSVGLGKTHLLHAICNEFRRRFPQQRMCLFSCADFTNAFIQALGHNQIETFRRELRSVDLLVIDDIHFLANKERTQEEFFNTFNRLHHRGCQIVLSSDAAPGDIPSLQERLVSRFDWGLVTCLEQPETETRMAILRRKATLAGLELPGDVVDFIAQNFRNNIRELEGALRSLRARIAIDGGLVDLAMAERTLGPLIRVPARQVDLPAIAHAVCAHFQVEIEDLKGRKRTRNISLPRQVVMYLARELTNLSLQEIGRWLGGRDHTTVLFGIKKIEERMAQDPRLAQLLDRLKDRLGAK